MSVLSSAALVRLVLLAVPLGASASPPPPDCEAGTRHFEVTADTPGKAHEVCIHPGLTTSFLFDTKLGRVELARREWFRVLADETGLTLVPTVALGDGERVPLTVSFQGGDAPAGVTFTLVVHPSEAARLVEVTRQPRTLASSREGEQQARAEARQCREEKARLESACAGRTGLLGLLAQELLGEGGIADKNITKSVTSRSGNTLQSIEASSYRTDTAHLEGGQRVVRLVVKQELWNHGSTPWTPAGAVLVSPKGVEWKALDMWTREPIPPGKSQVVGVEVEMTEEAARGTFTLKLWSQDGSAGELFDGVTFP
ncbi:DUF2381 family protein [Archangium lansingense]|uniref:DUF2381 family protein n=1 Tax=Archangium lansingense TaxID=2995310 RepID=A0ABT3ZU17_9BACT|nr:DUF2381 family protein [Archangium lansinium]MCY1072903.1 DUF2381 family protein [Archangium lansinium]